MSDLSKSGLLPQWIREISMIEWLIITVIIGIITAVWITSAGATRMCRELYNRASNFSDTIAVAQICNEQPPT